MKPTSSSQVMKNTSVHSNSTEIDRQGLELILSRFVFSFRKRNWFRWSAILDFLWFCTGSHFRFHNKTGSDFENFPNGKYTVAKIKGFWVDCVNVFQPMWIIVHSVDATYYLCTYYLATLCTYMLLGIYHLLLHHVVECIYTESV